MTYAIKIGSADGSGPLISDYGPMYVDGDMATIKFWDGWPEREMTFNHADPVQCAAALKRCREMEDKVVEARKAEAAVKEAEKRMRPWWRKLLGR